MLKAAFNGALLVLGAWADGNLVCIIRAVGDGASILYEQDILVYPEYQRMGIGAKLFQTILERYGEVCQTVLMTDNTPKPSPIIKAAILPRRQILVAVSL